MKTDEFEREILAPFLVVVHKECLQAGHQLEKYPVRLTIGDYKLLPICFKCNELFQRVMIEKSFLLIDEDESKIL